MNTSKLSEKIILFLARQLPYDKRGKREQEWLALLDYTPGNIPKLLCSISFIPVILKAQKLPAWIILLRFIISLFKYLFLFYREILKAIYLSIVLALSPIIIISLFVLTAFSLFNPNQSGLFSSIYLFLLTTPSFISLWKNGIKISASQLKFPSLWAIPKPYIHFWFLAQILSLIGIIQFDVHDISSKLNLFGLLSMYFLLWPLANRSLKNSELPCPPN